VSELSPSIQDGGGGCAIVATATAGGVYNAPAGSVITAITSLHTAVTIATAVTAGAPRVTNAISVMALDKGITIYGRWSQCTVAGTDAYCIAYLG